MISLGGWLFNDHGDEIFKIILGVRKYLKLSSFKINCFGVGTDPSEDRVTCGIMRVTYPT